MPADETILLGLGACTAIGCDAASTAAAIRAGVSGFARHRFMIDTAGEPMRVAAAPWLEVDLPATHRLEALLFPAIDEAFGGANCDGLRVALALGLPEPRPGLPRDLGPWARQAIAARYAKVFRTVALFQSGHAAVLMALEAALASMQRKAFDVCVVAGADTYLRPETLDWLEASDQLQGAGPLNNAWGFVPGEAAAALLVAGADAVDRLGLDRRGRVLAVASGVEANRIKTQTVCLGQALSEVLQRVLTVRPNNTRVSDVYSDMNGEPYRADEYGFAIARCGEAFERPSDMVTPADCTGDVGAAGGALNIALAAIAARKGYAAGNLAIVHAGSESGDRGAALIGFA